MEIKRLKVNFRDDRGEIRDILDDVPLNSVTVINSRKGVVRGNHFHKKTVQYLYVISGRIKYVSRKGKGPLRSALMRPGDLAMSPPGEIHAIVSLTDSSFLAISRGPRHGGNYEADTYRPADPLVKPKG